MSDVPFRKDSDLEKLRNIIVGDDHDLVKELQDRMDDPDRRSQDIAKSLSQAINKIQSEEDRIVLGEALSHPLETAVKLSIKKNPKTFSDLLYPVILPSIRRAVNEMMRAFVERIDRAISQRLSFKSLGWRMESFRTGVPYTEILMRHSILFSVEQALLIHRESGLLMQHAHTESAKLTDSDAVSGMLVAIEKFVQDSFVENDELLQRVTIGDHLVYVIDGPYALLACVVRGQPPGTFLEEMREILESIHAAEPDRLRKFSGDRAELNSLRPYMDRSLQIAYKDEDESDKNRHYKKIMTIVSTVVIVLLLSLLAYWGFKSIQENRINEYVIQLNQQPGVKILKHYKDDGIWYLEGLKDLQVDIVALPEESLFLRQEQIKMNLAAFQGMDDSVILDRASNFLAIPETLSTTLEESVLKLEGQAPVSWYVDAKKRINLPAGINQIDLSAVALDQQEIFSFLRQVIQPPKTVAMQSGDSGIRYSGIASLDWINSLQSLIKNFPPKIEIDTSALQSTEENRLLKLLQTIGEKQLVFVDKTVMSPGSEKVILQTAMTLTEIDRLASVLEKDYEIVITGYTDEIGAEELNQTLRRARAEFVLQKLKLYGINPGRVVTEPDTRMNELNQRLAGFTARLIDNKSR